MASCIFRFYRMLFSLHEGFRKKMPELAPLKTRLREWPMITLTGRYSFRQENRPDDLRDTTVAGPGVHHESGDRQNVPGGRSGKRAEQARSEWRSCFPEVIGSVRKRRLECAHFQILPWCGRRPQSGFYVRGSFSWLPRGKGHLYEDKHAAWNRYWPLVRPQRSSEKGSWTGFETTVWQETFSWSSWIQQKVALGQVMGTFSFYSISARPEKLQKRAAVFFNRRPCRLPIPGTRTDRRYRRSCARFPGRGNGFWPASWRTWSMVWGTTTP